MLEQFRREALLIGENNIEKLNNSKVVVFGIGGVGSFVVEGLARAGIGKFILIDNDDISISNLNRQLIATHSTIGEFKVDVAKKRILDINSKADVEIRKEFFMPDSEDFFDSSIDYIVDCIDTITAKLEIIVRAKKHGIKVISSMGTGNKLDPTQFEISDIYKTSVCPLAKIMRKELKARNIKDLKVLYSKEIPIKNKDNELSKGENTIKKVVPGSISFVPSVAGLIIAREIIKDLISE